MGIGIKNNGGASKVKIDGINPNKRMELERLDSDKSSINILELAYPIKADKKNGSTINTIPKGVLSPGFAARFGRIKDDIYLFSTNGNWHVTYQKFNFKTGWDTNITVIKSYLITNIHSVITDTDENNIYIIAEPRYGSVILYKFDGERLSQCLEVIGYPQSVFASIYHNKKIYYVSSNLNYGYIYDIEKNACTLFSENYKPGEFFKFKGELYFLDGEGKIFKIGQTEGSITEVGTIPSGGQYCISFKNKLYRLGYEATYKTEEKDTERRGCYSIKEMGEGWVKEGDLPFVLEGITGLFKTTINFIDYKDMYITMNRTGNLRNYNIIQVLTDKNILTEVM